MHAMHAQAGKALVEPTKPKSVRAADGGKLVDASNHRAALHSSLLSSPFALMACMPLLPFHHRALVMNLRVQICC